MPDTDVVIFTVCGFGITFLSIDEPCQDTGNLRNRSPEILEIPSSIGGSAARNPSPFRAPWASRPFPHQTKSTKPYGLAGLQRIAIRPRGPRGNLNGNCRVGPGVDASPYRSEASRCARPSREDYPRFTLMSRRCDPALRSLRPRFRGRWACHRAADRTRSIR